MSAAFESDRPLSDFLRVLVAPFIWFTHLVIVYAAEALVCIGPPADRGNAMGLVVFLASTAALTSLAILAAGILRAGNTAPPTANQERTWFTRVSLLLTLLSILGVIWTVLPTLVLPACALSAALQG